MKVAFENRKFPGWGAKHYFFSLMTNWFLNISTAQSLSFFIHGCITRSKKFHKNFPFEIYC